MYGVGFYVFLYVHFFASLSPKIMASFLIDSKNVFSISQLYLRLCTVNPLKSIGVITSAFILWPSLTTIFR
jgi:hypothetical protein